jgi:hypothetical protein
MGLLHWIIIAALSPLMGSQEFGIWLDNWKEHFCGLGAPLAAGKRTTGSAQALDQGSGPGDGA